MKASDFAAGAIGPWLCVIAFVLLGAGCGGASENPCANSETIHLKMSGSCSATSMEFDLQSYGCRLTIAAPGPPGLPPTGALDQAADPIRRGGWQIFGCLSGVEPCRGQFRRCTAKRVSWWLDLTCLDDAGAPVCQATLNESF